MKKFKKFKELTIGDHLYYLELSYDIFPLSVNDMRKMVLNDNVLEDTIIDKYNHYKIELNHFGFMEFENEEDLEKQGDFLEGDDGIMLISTKREGIDYIIDLILDDSDSYVNK